MKATQLAPILASPILILLAVVLGFFWFVCRVDVGPDECLVLTKKTGTQPPPGAVIAEPGQAGVQREPYGPGRYFFIPWLWESEKQPLTRVSAGDPATWREVYAAGDPDYGVPKLEGQWPQVGVVTCSFGKVPPADSVVVEPGYRGVQRAVLTPGTYRLNPSAYKVEYADAKVVPLGCVGVVTSQIGETPGTEVIRETSIGPSGELIEGPAKNMQKLAEEGQRGVLKNVLPPGLYYINPYVYQVKIVQIGYNQLTQTQAKSVDEEITFPSSDGFDIAIEVTVVWGRDPQYTPMMIQRLAEVERIKQLILVQTRSICRNIGSMYKSTDFIEGEKRELYQQKVTETLQRVCRARNIEILIALIQNIDVRGSTSDDEGLDLKQTIQSGYIAQEENLTKQKQQETASKKAELEAKLAEIGVARENVAADTRKMVAQIRAEGEKKAEEIDAQRDLEVAQIDRQIAELDAQRVLRLGEANAAVERMKRQADADGKRAFVEAFGTGRAYNLYTFAESFSPDSIRLIFAGEGTFWTDLTKLQDAAAMELLKGRKE